MNLDPSAVRHGRVHGRYFRENFAQGGIDLVQIIPEVVTNADAAIAMSGRPTGRIELEFARPDPDFLRDWRRAMRRLRSPALTDWRHELRCIDDGIGMDVTAVDERLGALGATPDHLGQRGLFGRGLRDVWLAQGAGRIQGVRGGRAVESWFFPDAGNQPYAYVHVLDEPATPELRAAVGVEESGTRITVPLSLTRLPPNGTLRRLVSQLVQLSPVLEDPAREVWVGLPGEPAQLVVRPIPEPDPERPVLFDDEVTVAPGVTARITVRRAAKPIPVSPSRATRLGGLVVRSGRAAHETTLGSHDGEPGARHLFGEVVCDALEELQRSALRATRPQVVVKVDRSGLNEHHPVVRRLYDAIGQVLKPIIAEEERRAGAHLIRAGRALQERDAVGLRALNEALRSAFDQPGLGGVARAEPAALEIPRPAAPAAAGPEPVERPPEPEPPIRFKQNPLRLHAGEQRAVSLLLDAQAIRPGTPLAVTADAGIRVRFPAAAVPEPGRRGRSRLMGTIRARAGVQPGSRLTAVVEAGGHAAELTVLVVRHRSGGWVREIARKDEDSLIEAHFDPETGVVTVFEGRPEFKALERAAKRAGLSRSQAREYLPYRMLEVEVAANAVYAWAAEQIVTRRLAAELRGDGAAFTAAVRLEAQGLRHRAHEKLMRAFLDPEVFGARPRTGRAGAPKPSPLAR